MADETSNEGTSSSQATGENSETTFEINIKTLDSQIYPFRVNKNMPVLLLKEKIVNVTGVPVGQQRLIFRGKVLKDDHLLSEYHLEDGHTLHLVARQPGLSQPTPGTSSEESARNGENEGNDSTTGAPRNRQVPPNFVVGSVNLGEQGEGIATDISRIIGAVLNSIGLGTLAPTGGASNISSATINAGGRTQAGNTAQPGVTNLNQSFQPLFQASQFPSTGQLSRHMVIPDSLTTLSEFISRMELALLNGGSQPSPSPNNVRDTPRPDISLNPRGIPTPQELCSVVLQVQQLLSGSASAALSNIAARVEREGPSTDPIVRGQVQTEAMNVGIAMQHLGAMLLELGRTIMTLRMGRSPAESLVNAGPAVYISATGPNPIMVQPFPHQTSSLFSVPPSPLVSGGVSLPVSLGDPSRNISIHIHAGTSVPSGVSSATTRTNTGEATRGEHQNNEQASVNGNGSGESAPTQGLPSRTVVASVPARSVTDAASHVLSVVYPILVRSQQPIPSISGSAQGSRSNVSNGAQPNMGTPASLPPSESDIIPSLVAQINAQIRTLAVNAQGRSSSSPIVQSTDTQGLVGSGAPPNLAGPLPQPPSESDTIPTNVAQLNTHITSALAGNSEGQSSSSPSVKCADKLCVREGSELAPPASISSGLGEDDVISQSKSIADTGAGVTSSDSVCSHAPEIGMPECEVKQLQLGLQLSNNEATRGGLDMESSTSSLMGDPTICPANDLLSSKPEIEPLERNSESVANIHASGSSLGKESCESDRPAPLGLGLGGLQPKRRGKQAKSIVKDESHGTPSVVQNQQSIARGQEVLRSLLSQCSDMTKSNANGSSNTLSSVIGRITDGKPSGGQGTSGQSDVANMMSQVLQSPALNSILSGMSEQAGIGSPADMRSILEQLTQNSSSGNMLNETAQSLAGQTQDLGGMLLGLGRGEGGIDFSRMIQQMMPVVSQVLGRGSTRSIPVVESEPQALRNNGRTAAGDILDERNSQIDLQLAVESIERQDAPGNVFRALLESAGHLYGEGNGYEDLIEELVNDVELTNEFMEMLHRHIGQRLQTKSILKDKS